VSNSVSSTCANDPSTATTRVLSRWTETA
jgi:hypothetical protein